MMANLWERLTHIYGHRFASAYGSSALSESGELTDVAKTWASGLAGVTGEQLAAGLRACIDNPDEWPTLPMFKALCVGKAKNGFGLDYTPEYHRPRTLDKSQLLANGTWEERKATASPHLSAMREKLGLVKHG